MKILFLTQIIPYPPDAGPRVKTWNVLRYLANHRHEVTLVSFVRPEEQEHVAALRKICEAVHTVPIRRSRISDIYYLLRSQISGRPFIIERDDLPAMRRLVEKLSTAQKFDALHADQLTMTQFGLPKQNARTDPTKMATRHSPALIFDAHNAVWTITARLRQNAPWFLQPLLAAETQRIKRYEGSILHRFDFTLTVAAPDRQALFEAADLFPDLQKPELKRVPIIPIAVDPDQLQPTPRPHDSRNILTLGTLHYPPNADGIRWFIQEIYPIIRNKVPGTTLTVVGKNPPADFHALAKNAPGDITITGYVPDLDPYLEKAALMVVPVRAGGGIRVRILEAFARGIPVVTTTIGLEGIDARPGEDVLVEDSPASFAEAVIKLLSDQNQRNALSINGRRLAETRYNWQVVLKDLDAIYASIPQISS